MMTTKWSGTLIEISRTLPEGEERKFIVVIFKRFEDKDQ